MSDEHQNQMYFIDPQTQRITLIPDGPTLRDQFAMAALTSMLSPIQDITPTTPEYAAKLAYEFADAMLEARK